jgi:hypothetical protein
LGVSHESLDLFLSCGPYGVRKLSLLQVKEGTNLIVLPVRAVQQILEELKRLSLGSQKLIGFDYVRDIWLLEPLAELNQFVFVSLIALDTVNSDQDV